MKYTYFTRSHIYIFSRVRDTPLRLLAIVVLTRYILNIRSLVLCPFLFFFPGLLAPFFVLTILQLYQYKRLDGDGTTGQTKTTIDEAKK